MKGEKEFVIVDEQDGEIFFKGTEEQLKEKWWKMLKKDREVGGFQLMSKSEYEKEFGNG